MKAGQPDAIALLLERGANVDARSNHGKTPLDYAVTKPEIAALLLGRGAAPSHDDLLSALRASPPVLAEIEHLLDQGADVNAKDSNGNTPLHLVSRHLASNPEIAVLLLDRGADVNARNDNGVTPLHWWVGNVRPGRKLAMIELLLDRGAAVNAGSDDGTTPLRSASNPEIAALLLDRGADIDAKPDGGQTPLYAAWHVHKNMALVNLLLDRGANVNIKNGLKHETFLVRAVRDFDVEMIARIVDLGVDVNAKSGIEDNVTPLSAACRRGDPAIIELLLDRGANPNAQGTTTHWAALHVLVMAGHPDDVVIPLINLMLDRGADVDAYAVQGGGADGTPLHFAVGNYPETSLKVITLLLDRGADVNYKAFGLDSITGTPLHVAARFNPDTSVAALLLDRGADLNADIVPEWLEGRETHGRPLHYAANYNDNGLKMVNFLLDQGAGIESTAVIGEIGGFTALHLAAWGNSNPAVASTLLDRGANIEARTDEGLTPLHVTVAKSRRGLPMAALLLDRGADIDARTNDGWTALHFAASMTGIPSPDRAALLLDRGADVNAKDNRGM